MLCVLMVGVFVAVILSRVRVRKAPPRTPIAPPGRYRAPRAARGRRRNGPEKPGLRLR